MRSFFRDPFDYFIKIFTRYIRSYSHVRSPLRNSDFSFSNFPLLINKPDVIPKALHHGNKCLVDYVFLAVHNPADVPTSSAIWFCVLSSSIHFVFTSSSMLFISMSRTSLLKTLTNSLNNYIMLLICMQACKLVHSILLFMCWSCTIGAV